MAKAGFSGVIEVAPNKQTKLFAGRPINLSAVAREVNVAPSLLSRVFSRKRQPSLSLTRRLSTVLGMTLDEFVTALNNNDAVDSTAPITMEECA